MVSAAVTASGGFAPLATSGRQSPSPQALADGGPIATGSPRAFSHARRRYTPSAGSSFVFTQHPKQPMQ